MNTPFTFSKTPSLCPCGEHKRFNKLTSHPTGGKCWTCNKFFSPNKGTPTPASPEDNVTIQEKIERKEDNYTKEFVRQHIYWNETGDNYLMKIVIYRNSFGKKLCFQYKWTGMLEWSDEKQAFDKIGTWERGIEGVNLTLYNAPLINTFRTSLHRDEFSVYIVEGEKDVDTLWQKFGKLATCNPMGAGKWKSSYSSLLRGLNCVILPDNDDAGALHAQMVYDSLKGVANKVIIYNLTDSMPDLPHKGDVTDYIERGGTL